jgi:hypothetical protein
MRIEITEKEITAGVRVALETTLGLKLEGKHFDVDYSMGRGKNGLSGVATITDPSVVPTTPANASVDVPGFTDAAESEVVEAAVETEPEVEEVAAVATTDSSIFGDD